MGNERLIIDFLGRIRFGRSPYTARSVAVYGSSVATGGSFGCVGIRIGGRGGTPVEMPYFRCTRRIRGDVVVVLVGPPLGLTLPAENFLHYHHVAAPALRSRTHVSAFALVVYRHDPDGAPIAAY